MEVEEETTSNQLQESIAAETTTTVINETLLENTTSIDKQSEKQLSNLAPESNSHEEEDSSVSVPKSEVSEAFVSAAAGEKVEDTVVHSRNLESVAALSGGDENSLVVESMSVVRDSKDGDDGAVKEIDVAAVECGGSELTCSVKDDGGEGGEAVGERNGDPEVVEEKVGNDGEFTNVGEFLETEKDENEGDEMVVGAEGKHEDAKETEKEEDDAEVLKVEGGVHSSPVVLVHNDGGDEMTDQSKNDGDLNVRSEDVENVQGMVGSDVRNDGDGDAQVENIDNLQEDEAVAEEPVGPEIVKEEDNVSDEDVREDLQEEASLPNEETVDGVGENEEEEPMEEDEEKSLDTDIETEKSLDIEMESVKSVDTEMETEEETNLEDEEKVQEADIETEPELPESSKKDSGKRKRGGKFSKTTSRKTMEEDVCFICFDGGNLVLCDRRNCPKAYHPSCVNRDEAFFQSKGSWNCGWHLCSICEKKAEYMCYTCTYSVCKSCVKTSDMLCVREKEKKGLCEACMRTVMLIENPENQENVNFDDENSWEHLFKDYWSETKAKHDLSLSELIQAKKQESSITQSDVKDEGNSDNPPENPSPRKTRRQTKKQKSDATSDDYTPEWVSKELLELITHMKNGDSSIISQYEVQDLLLEYIKRNKLRDPNKKSQIICDTRLETLFGKPRVAHIEMLKLLESHFLTREDSQVDDFQGSVVDDDETNETPKDKKRKGKKKGDKREPQTNREDYAMIDIHNINLIYMRRKLVEDLLDDMEMFRDKIVGTFVRIRVSGANLKQDIYRLVQVTGTSEGAEYTLGKRTTCTMLEILNLDKTEIIPIDTISNQEFTEDECKRLRQSIKCGLINRLTVGDILDKAMELQVARVNDWLETEVVRLNHLRDRASDLGRFKELKECVEKLNLLKGPEERARRLEEFPLVHDDPTMNPQYESEEDTNSDDHNRRELYKRSDSFGYNKRGRDQFSPRGDYNYNSNSKESWSGTPRNSRKNYEFTRNLSNKNYPVKNEDATMSSYENIENSRDHEQRAPFVQQPIKSEKPNLVVNTQTSVSQSGPKVNESDKLWHYKDPSGKIQGPFSLTKLRNWSKNGYFPARLKIWKKSEKEDDGILLSDALEGNFQNNPSPKPENRPDFTNVPSPTPVKSSTGWPVGQGQGPSSTPNSSSTSAGPSLVPCGNKDANAAGTSVIPVAPENVVQIAPGGNVGLTPQMVQAVSGQIQSQSQSQIQNQNPQGWNSGGQQVMNMGGMGMQPMVYNQWPGGPTMVQDPSGNFIPQPMVAAPPQQYPFPVNQTMQQAPQPNVNWGTMAMNPNMVWAGPNPGMAWGPMVQGPQVTGTMDPNWVQVPGWVPQPQPQPPVPGVGVAAPNQTWVAPPNGNPGWVGAGGGWVQNNVNPGWNQGGAPGTNMGWVQPPPPGNQVQGAIATPTPALAQTPTPPGNSNQNWGPRNQGNWGGNERGGFSGQRRNRGSGFHGNNRRNYNNNNNNSNNSNKQESFHKDGRSSSFHGGSSGDSVPASASASAPAPARSSADR